MNEIAIKSKFLWWIARKHNNEKIVNELITACANDFKKIENITEEQLVDIYSNHKNRLQLEYDTRLRNNLKTDCNS